MEALVFRHEGTAIVKDVRKEIDAVLARLYGKPDAEGGGVKSGRSSIRGGDRKSAKQEVRCASLVLLAPLVGPTFCTLLIALMRL